MAMQLTNKEARHLRFRAQCLTGDQQDEKTVWNVVRDCCGLQAQDVLQASLSLRARCPSITKEEIEGARELEQSIVRTWCMRGTLHFVASSELPLLLSLFGQLYVSRGQRRLTELGFDETDSENAVSVIREALSSEGPLTRREIAEHLLHEGHEFDPDGQAPFHVVRRACLEGIAIESGSRDGTETYALLEDVTSLENAPEQETALEELARRYVKAFEPASLDDFHNWSGLYMSDARTGWEAIADELTEVEVAGERTWIITSPDEIDVDSNPVVRFLPMYDNYFLGHQDRSLILPKKHADQVYPGGGVIRATVVVDGQTVGTWTIDRSRSIPVVEIEPFETVDPSIEPGIQAEVEDIGRFLGTEIEHRIAA